MNYSIDLLVNKHFNKLMVTFRQLESFYRDYVFGSKIVIFGAGQNTIDAAQGMLPFFLTNPPPATNDFQIIGIEPKITFFNKAYSLAQDLQESVGVDIQLLHANPLTAKVPNADTIILPRTLHELLLMQNNEMALDELVKVCLASQQPGGMVLLVDPNYRPEVYTSTPWPQQEIQNAIEDIAKVYGHFHPPAELLNPDILISAFENNGYKLVTTTWMENESTNINDLVGAHFTVFKRIHIH